MTFPMYQNKLEFLMTFLFSIALSVAFIGYSKYTYIDIRPFADVLIAIILTIAAARNKTFIRLNAYLFIYLVFWDRSHLHLFPDQSEYFGFCPKYGRKYPKNNQIGL